MSFLLAGIYLQFVKYRGNQQGVVNLPLLPHFTAHCSSQPPVGSVSHSTPDAYSPPDLRSLSKQLVGFTKSFHLRSTMFNVFLLIF